jgi:hypothetical protein
MFCIAWRHCFGLGSLKKPFDSLRNQFGRIGGRLDKMKFYLKTSEQMYDIEPGRTIKSFLGNVVLASRLIGPIFLL